MDKKTDKKPATEAATSGKMGELEWSFADGVLTISGDGEIPDYDDYTSSTLKYKRHTPDGKIYRPDKHRSPWYPFREQITKIVFNGNITKKSLYVFHGFENLSSVTFENHAFPSTYGDIIDRAMQGYTLVNIWNIDSWFIEQIYRMLQEFKQKADLGAPAKMSFEEWGAILERMIFCFKEANEKTCSVKNESYQKAMLTEGLELFCKHLRNLWW